MSSRVKQLLQELLLEPGVSIALSLEDERTVSLRIDIASREIYDDICEIAASPALLKRKAAAIEEETPVEEEVPLVHEDDFLLDLYKTKTTRQLHQLRPDVFTTKGEFNKTYKRLRGRVQKPTTGHHGVITNRPWVSLAPVSGTPVHAGFVDPPVVDYEQIVIAFTRASSLPPTYGQQGMFERGATAGKAWMRTANVRRSIFVSLPRRNIASKTPLNAPNANIREMILVLDAARSGTEVILMSIRIDGLTTDLGSLTWLYNTWGNRLTIFLIVAVQPLFPGSQKAFPRASNGVRYGRFELRRLVDIIALEPSQREQLSPEGELVSIISMIRELKTDRNNGYLDLVDWTSGRGNFRVCPDSEFDSGADENNVRLSRTLR